MTKTHAPYAPEFRRQIIELVRTGRDPANLFRDWVAQADRQEMRAAARGRRRRSDSGGARGVGTAAAGEQANQAGARYSLSSCGLVRPRDRRRAVRVFGFMSASQAMSPVAAMAHVLGVSEAGYTPGGTVRQRDRSFAASAA